jgi:hypothetical protein
MLKDRGYIVSEKKLNQTKAEFSETYQGSRESLNLLIEKRQNVEEGEGGAAAQAEEVQKMIVFFPDQDKLNM